MQLIVATGRRKLPRSPPIKSLKVTGLQAVKMSTLATMLHPAWTVWHHIEDTGILSKFATRELPVQENKI